MAFQFDPVSNQGLTWITARDLSQSKDLPIQPSESKLYPTLIPGINYSINYKSFIRDSFELLQDLIKVSTQMDLQMRNEIRWDNGLSENIKQYCELIDQYSDNNQRLADVNIIIRCFNAIRFIPDTRNNISKDFADWVNSASIDYSINDEGLNEIVGAGLSHPSFWQTIYVLAIRNMTRLCSNCLQSVAESLHNKGDRTAFQLVIDLLLAYPENAVLDKEYQKWKDEVASLYRVLQQMNNEDLKFQLELLFKILLGDRTTILTFSRSWFEAMCGFLCYNDGTKKRLEDYYIIATEAFPVDHSLTWEDGCAAVIRGDFLVAIEKIESLDPYVAAVISECCEVRGLMDVYTDGSFTQVRHWLLINYAKLCLEDSKISPVGVQLLRILGDNESIEIFAEYAPRLALYGTEAIDMIIDTSMHFGLEDTIRITNQIAAKQHESQGDYLDAMTRYLDARDNNSLRNISWKLFEKCLLDQKPIESMNNVVDHTLDFEISPLVRECVSPYAVLATAFENLSKGLLSKAGKCFVALLDHPYLPEKYLISLFVLIEKLMDRSHSKVFSNKDLKTIMEAINKWQDRIEKNASVKSESITILKALLRQKGDKAGASIKEISDSDIDDIISIIVNNLSAEYSRCLMES